LTASWCQEIRLVFDGNDGRLGWHQAHRRITTGDIDDCGEDGSGHEAMMLRQVSPKREHDFHFAGRYPSKRCAYRSINLRRSKLS